MRHSRLCGILVRLAVYDRDVFEPSCFTVCEAYMPLTARQNIVFWQPDARRDTIFSDIEVHRVRPGKAIRLVRWFGWRSFGIRHCVPNKAVSVNLGKKERKPPTLNNYKTLQWKKINLGPWREFWKPMYFPPPWGPLRNDTSGLLLLAAQVERTMAEIPNDYSFLVFPQKLHTPLLRKSVFELAAEQSFGDTEEPWYTRQVFFLEREPRILHESIDPSTVEYHEHTDSQGVIHRWETGIKSVVYDLSPGKVVEIHNFMASNAVRYTREQEAFAKRQALQRGYQGSFE